MWHFYYINRTLNDLTEEAFLKNISISELKAITKIIVLDDDEFAFLESLQKSEFRIERRPDIQALSDVAEYDIILCDIRGVGKFLESQYEGAYLVKKLKEKYPKKIIISYTAGDYSADYQKFLGFADAIVPKGTSLEDWDSLLTSKLIALANPIELWKKTRTALFDSDVPTIVVAKYEALYVKSVQNKSFDSMKKLISQKNNKESEILKSILKTVAVKVIERAI